MACQPLKEAFWEASPRRVKSNFDDARFVVTADVIDIRKARISELPESRFEFDVERTTFRVRQAFKGDLKPGATFVIETGWTSCGRDVRSPDWIVFDPRKKPDPSAYPKRWLIYYTPPEVIPGPGPQPPPFEIASSPRSVPVDRATYDIGVLKRYAGAWNLRR